MFHKEQRNELVKEFKEFAMRGNVVDLAVGVVIGSAFGKIVSSFVSNIVMPPLNLITAKYGCQLFRFSAEGRYRITKPATGWNSGKSGGRIFSHEDAAISNSELWPIHPNRRRLPANLLVDLLCHQSTESTKEEARGCTGGSRSDS